MTILTCDQGLSLRRRGVRIFGHPRGRILGPQWRLGSGRRFL